MDKKTQQQLIDDHFLFKEGDRFLQAANACRYWPVGRGIYHNDNKTFLVWVNEEDHLRLICAYWTLNSSKQCTLSRFLIEFLLFTEQPCKRERI